MLIGRREIKIWKLVKAVGVSFRNELKSKLFIYLIFSTTQKVTVIQTDESTDENKDGE